MTRARSPAQAKINVSLQALSPGPQWAPSLGRMNISASLRAMMLPTRACFPPEHAGGGAAKKETGGKPAALISLGGDERRCPEGGKTK